MSTKRKFKDVEFIDLSGVPEERREMFENMTEGFFADLEEVKDDKREYTAVWNDMLTNLEAMHAKPEDINIVRHYIKARRAGRAKEDVWEKTHVYGVQWDTSLSDAETEAKAAEQLKTSIASIGAREFLESMTAEETATVMPELSYKYQFSDIVEGQALPKEKKFTSASTWFSKADPRIEQPWIEGLAPDVGTSSAAVGAVAAPFVLGTGPLGALASVGLGIGAFVPQLGHKADTPENLTVDSVTGVSKSDVLYPGYTTTQTGTNKRFGLESPEVTREFDIEENIEFPAVREMQLVDFAGKQYAIQQLAAKLDESYFQNVGMALDHDDIMDTSGLTHAEKVVNYYLGQDVSDDSTQERVAMMEELRGYETEFKSKKYEDQLQWGLENYLMPGGFIDSEETSQELETLVNVANRIARRRVYE